MMDLLEDFKTFLDHSPTPWHAVREIQNRLKDFSVLDEGKKWTVSECKNPSTNLHPNFSARQSAEREGNLNESCRARAQSLAGKDGSNLGTDFCIQTLERGKRYCVIRDGAIAAFTLPTQEMQSAIILAAHTDSPALKLKAKASYQEKNMHQLRVEPYGAPLLSSWLNRDLRIAGRMLTLDQQGSMQERLVCFDVPCFIPQLAIHLDREVNEKGLILNKHEHLSPILGLGDEAGAPLLDKLLAGEVPEHTVLTSELFLVPREKAAFVGRESSLLSSYRLDNLASVHAALLALVDAQPQEHSVQMALFWDNEEIGSRTREGAASPFLSDLLQRISLALQHDPQEFFMLKHNSFCVSIDVAHAYNPNYSQKHDPQHLLLPSRGIAIKQNADQKYASSAVSSAKVAKACADLNLPCQYYANRADIPSGSTVGPIVAANGITTIDIGSPLFSMHSIRETVACQDHLDLKRLLAHLLTQVAN